MNTLVTKTLIFSVACSFYSTFSYSQDKQQVKEGDEIKVRTIIENTLQEIPKIESASYTLNGKERGFKGEYKTVLASVKLTESPKRIVIRAEKPLKANLLFISGENNDKILVNRGVTVKMDPYSGVITKQLHKPVHQNDFEEFSKALNIERRLLLKGQSYTRYLGEVEFNGKSCHKIEFNKVGYRISYYIAKQGDNLMKIINSIGVYARKVLELNPNLSSKFTQPITEGLVLKVPNRISKKSIYIIDKDAYIPVGIQIFDEKGLIREYYYHNLIINAPIAESQFSFN